MRWFLNLRTGGKLLNFEMMLTRDTGTLQELVSVIREGQDDIDEGLEGITRLHTDEPEFMRRPRRIFDDWGRSYRN